MVVFGALLLAGIIGLALTPLIGPALKELGYVGAAPLSSDRSR